MIPRYCKYWNSLLIETLKECPALFFVCFASGHGFGMLAVLVDHFPIVPSSASISDISTGRVFNGTDASSLLTRLNPLTDPTTYHWSSAIDGKPSWAILDDETEILHVRAHDCPMPATPLHPTCYDCITSEFSDDSEFVFMWKTTRVEELSQRSGGLNPLHVQTGSTTRSNQLGPYWRVV